LASIVQDFEYDIFISYRQKDNRHNGWVNDFVSDLKGELESTFKYEINVYFDVNTHDGLLENHDVDATLHDKLKCLIFIPIISRTYCDPKSFAWEHEFKAFTEMASRDALGLRVKLRGGNVAGRILPIIIHDLDPEDINQCESIIGGHLRGIEFIYKEPGVNKPLTSEDDEKKNLNRTKYWIQINKVANAIREIMVTLTSQDEKKEPIQETRKIPSPNNKSIKRLIFTAIMLSLVIAIGWLIIPPKNQKQEVESDNTIAVLPFKNMSDGSSQEWFSDVMVGEILNYLFQIGGLEITNKNSSMLFKDSKLTTKEIAHELNVRYLIEGGVERAGDKARIIVTLVDGNGTVRWSKPYNTTISGNNWLDVLSNVAEQIANELKIQLDSSVKTRFAHKPTENSEAYDLYLQSTLGNPIKENEALLRKAISLDPNFADAYARLAFVYIMEGGHGGSFSREQVLEKAEPIIDSALHLDKYSVEAHLAIAHLKLYYYWDFKAVTKEYDLIKKISPSNSNDLPWFSDYLLAQGNFKDAFLLQQGIFDHNRNNPNQWSQVALTSSYMGDTNRTISYLKEANELFPKNDFMLLNTIRIYNYFGKYADAIKIYNEKYKEGDSYLEIPYFKGHLGIAYYKVGSYEKSNQCLNTLTELSKKTSLGSPSYFAAAIYTAMNRKEEALNMLEKARLGKEVEMYWLKVEPLFLSLQKEPRFKEILSKMGID
jgi:TolB-like protein/Tfp pilus assembly protein PilF